MKNLVMTICIKNKIFAISLDDQKNTLTAIGMNNEYHLYPVVNDKELKLINLIIDKNIRKVYFELDKVSFENEEYIRFKNRYNSKYYFALAKDEEKRIIDYVGNEKLYDYFNPKKIIYAYDNRKSNYNNPYGSIPGQSTNSFGGFNNDFSNNFNSGFGNNPYGFTPTYYQPKRSNIGKKIAIAIGGVVGAAIITISGIKLVTSTDFPSVISNNHQVVTQGEANEYGLYDIDVEPIKEEKLNEEQQELKNKYDGFKKKLEKQGFKSWEIAVILSTIKQANYITERAENGQNAKYDNISFYYDHETDSVVYVYGDIDRVNIQNLKRSDNNISYDYESLSKEVKELVDVLNDNPNITDEQKKIIREKFSNTWQECINYYIEDGGFYYSQLKSRLEQLTIKKLPFEEGYKVGASGNSHTGAAGYFDPSTKEILLFGDSKSVLEHEVGHAIGSFGPGNTLLTEGYNEWKNGGNSRYANERFMAFAFEEVFGEETLREAYVKYYLSGVLSDKLVEKTGMNRDEADETIYNLLRNTQSALYKLGERYDKDKDLSFEDEDIIEKFKNVMQSLNDINSRLGNPENNKLNAISDYFTNNKNSVFLQSAGEKILSFDYLENGSLLVEIGSRKDIKANGEVGTINAVNISRYKIVDDRNIDSAQLSQIYDYELNHFIPHTVRENKSQEGKDGVEDCMEDEEIKPSIIDRIKRFFSKDKGEYEK